MPTGNTVEILQKLQDGAAKNNATVMLQGENFRITRSDGTSQLWEPKSDSSLTLLEEADANGNPNADVKTGGSSGIDGVIKAMVPEPPKEEKKAKATKDEDEGKHSHAHR